MQEARVLSQFLFVASLITFSVEKSGTRVFVNVPDWHEIQVADLTKGSVLAHWPVSCTDNFPMTLDEAHHRLFVSCRMPTSLMVFDTETGKSVPSLDTASSDDIFYDAGKGRVYVLGQAIESGVRGAVGPGSVDVFQQNDADHYTKIANYPTGWGAWTGYFVSEWGELFCLCASRGRVQCGDSCI